MTDGWCRKAYLVAKNISKEVPNFRLGVGTSPLQNEEYPDNQSSLWASNRVQPKHQVQTAEDTRDMFNNFDSVERKLEEINASAFRFGISWSRVEPEEGKFDESALKEYASWIKKISCKNIKIYITLMHFDIPHWWENKYKGLATDSKNGINCFRNYITRVLETFNSENVWEVMKKENIVFITLNEPFLQCLHGYLLGERPPYKHLAIKKFKRAIVNCARLHIAAYETIKHLCKGESTVGIATNVVVFESSIESKLFESQRKITIEERKRGFSQFYNFSIVDLIMNGKATIDMGAFNFLLSGFNSEVELAEGGNKMDCFCINHYNVIKLGLMSIEVFSSEKGDHVNNMGWMMHEESLYNALVLVNQKYNLPIHITEFGTCANSTTFDIQSWVLVSSLQSIYKALKEGIKIEAAVLWTLVDNWEFEEGYIEQEKHGGFGLYGHKDEKKNVFYTFKCAAQNFCKNVSTSYIF
jgi:beta-glucosidase